MKIGHINLEKRFPNDQRHLVGIIESLDKMAVTQQVLVADAAIARSLSTLPHTTVGPVVRSPVMANCLLPTVDIVHCHDLHAGRAGLILTLTRGIPYVLSSVAESTGGRRLDETVRKRARAVLLDTDLDSELLLQTYTRLIGDPSKLPENSNGR